jgi:RHS repeat-associated protein
VAKVCWPRRQEPDVGAKSEKLNSVPKTYTFKYDPFGRRIYKSSSAGTSVYAYDGDNLIEEANSTGTVVARYEQTQIIDEPLAMLRSGATSYYHADGLGSVTSLSSSAGAIANTYTYDSFGKPTASTGSLVNPFRYTARESDTETGLYYYRARYYDENTGRFLSEDAARFDSGTDLYAYVQNNAPNFVDPLGLYTQDSKVPPLNKLLDNFMKCMDKCTGMPQHVNATTNGVHTDPGHAAGTTVDLKPIGTPSRKLFCCAGQCGAAYGLDERFIRTRHGQGFHYHIQWYYPEHPDLKKYPDSIPKTPECQPHDCGDQ